MCASGQLKGYLRSLSRRGKRRGFHHVLQPRYLAEVVLREDTVVSLRGAHVLLDMIVMHGHRLAMAHVHVLIIAAGWVCVCKYVHAISRHIRTLCHNTTVIAFDEGRGRAATFVPELNCTFRGHSFYCQ
jgi:hypothetical protein